MEKALAHETQGVWSIPIHDRAQYVGQRQEMPQRWGDFVDSQIQDGRGKVIIGPFGKAYLSAA